MITLRLLTEVTEDRRVVLVLPPEVPTGEAEIVVTIDSHSSNHKRPRTSLAEWAEAHAERWGGQLSSQDVEGFTGRRF